MGRGVDGHSGLLFDSQHADGGSGMTWDISGDNIGPLGEGSDCSLAGSCSDTLPQF